MFVINYQLCKEYTALSPYEIDDRAFGEVVDLYIDTRKIQMRKNKLTNPNRVIRRRAGDDWF